MKLKTAKRLNWPWKCEKYYDLALSKNPPSPLPALIKHGHPEFIAMPSEREMLERMPKGTKAWKSFNDGYGCSLYENGPYFKGTDLSEALALLCIWIRDNNLMEWKEGKG